MTRTCLHVAADAAGTRTRQGSPLRVWAVAIAKRIGPSKARVALARELAVILHALWRDAAPRQERAAA